ncbi:hypothetical protein HanPI659440_Chr12g0473801 [Helianthus annuus]|nr:hypothetical protein HanPI659440_Chr12g0473801 [Helianthus annuus]
MQTIMLGDHIRGGNSMVGGGGAVVNVDGGSKRTFLDSLLNKNKIDVIRIDDNVEGFVQWYDFAVTGKVVDFKSLTDPKTCLKVIGWTNVGIKYVSCFTVLFIFNSVEDRDKFCLEKESWADVFVTIDRWDGKQKMVEERIAWLQVHGIPVQLALDQVFDLVGSHYGEVVKPACMSIEDCNFSYAYIGVLCKSRGRIVDRVDISWRGDIFNVWINEDVGEWVPDCVEEFDYVFEEMDRGSEEEQNVELNFENANGDDVELGEIRGDEGSENVCKFNNGVDFFVAGRTESSAMVGTSVARKKFRRRFV